MSSRFVRLCLTNSLLARFSFVLCKPQSLKGWISPGGTATECVFFNTPTPPKQKHKKHLKEGVSDLESSITTPVVHRSSPAFCSHTVSHFHQEPRRFPDVRPWSWQEFSVTVRSRHAYIRLTLALLLQTQQASRRSCDGLGLETALGVVFVSVCVCAGLFELGDAKQRQGQWSLKGELRVVTRGER